VKSIQTLLRHQSILEQEFQLHLLHVHQLQLMHSKLIFLACLIFDVLKEQILEVIYLRIYCIPSLLELLILKLLYRHQLSNELNFHLKHTFQHVILPIEFLER
jgi:hypothetical protein